MYNKNINIKEKKRFCEVMKKTIVCAILAVAGVFSLHGANSISVQSPEFFIKSFSALTVGYDKSMSEKTIKAAVIDSYFRELVANGKIIRWNKSSFPLKVYVQDTEDVPGYYREIVMSAYQSWERASEGFVRFEIVESPDGADIKNYFKDISDANTPIGTQAFSVNGNTFKDSTVVFRKKDEKNHNLDSKQLYSSALQEIGYSLGLVAKSPSIYDVMYPIGTKFNTEITPRDLKTLTLLYSVVPDITNTPISEEEKAQLFTASEILATLNVPVDDTTNPDEVVANDIATRLALAEQYRKRAEYDKAAEEYQAVAQMKDDRRSKSEVYYEVAVMYLDAEEFDKAKSCAEIACATDMNDKTEILSALIDYYMKRSNSAVEQLDAILAQNPYNKYAYRLLCKIYRDKHQENLLNATIRKYGRTAGEIEE